MIPCGRLATASGGIEGGEGGEGGEAPGLMVGSGGEGGALGGTSRLIVSLLGVGPDALGLGVPPTPQSLRWPAPKDFERNQQNSLHMNGNH